MFQSLFDLMEQAGRLAGRLPALTLAQPNLELTDDGTALVARVSLHSVDPKSVQIEATDTGLTISGRSTREEETEGPDFYRAFAQSSHFFQQVPLPVQVDPSRSTAQWQADGSLVVRLTKR